MSSRLLIRLAAVLGAALLLWGALALARKRSFEGGSGPRLLAVDTAAVDSVIVRLATDTVRLARTGSAWRVNQFRAAPDEISGLLGTLADTGGSELIAESPGSHARLGVDSTGGRRVRVFDGTKVVVDVLVGKSEGGTETGYVRRFGDPAVYRIRSRFAELAGRKTDDWRDKNIVTVPADSIGSIAVRRGAGEYVLRRDGKRWRFVSGGTPDSNQTSNLVRDVAQIRAAGFAADSQMASLRFTRPDRRLVLKTSAGRTLAALVFDSTANGIWVRHDTGARGTVWRVESWDWDRIMPTKKSLEQP
jgi:Domain of unknown function (DUF4340)